jgi:hypothetical protein
LTKSRFQDFGRIPRWLYSCGGTYANLATMAEFESGNLSSVLTVGAKYVNVCNYDISFFFPEKKDSCNCLASGARIGYCESCLEDS